MKLEAPNDHTSVLGTNAPLSSDEVLVQVENVSKKFCRSLKRSLWYGVKDIAGELNPFRSSAKPSASLNQESRTKNQEHEASLRSGEFYAVRNVSFDLRRGECIGLIGHNGAGKTTLLKMLNGVIKPDSGTIKMRGRVGALIALGAGFNPILTGRENIYVNGSVIGLSKKEIDAKFNDIIEFADIGDFIDSPVQNYSSGMAIRLGFAVTSALQPDILLLDEVLAVGDVSFQAKCFNRLAEMREIGVPFILVSHNMHTIARYCHKVVFMKRGKIEFCGEAEEGIKRFLCDMKETGQEQSAGPDWSMVHGTGKVAFTGARFRNALGEVVTSITVGETFTLEIDYEARTQLARPPVLDVVMRDREGLTYQGTNISNGQPFQHLKQSGRFQVQFRDFPINTDYVDFFFSAIDTGTAEIFDWKRNFRLLLTSNQLNGGRVNLKSNWSCQ